MKKTVFRIIACLIACIFIAHSFPLNVLAYHDHDHGGTQLLESSEPSVYVSPKTARVDDIFEVEIMILNNPGIISFRISVDYDDTLLELLGASNAGLLYGYSAPSAVLSSPYVLRWADSFATENNTANGTIAVLRFRALSEGTSQITVTPSNARNVNGVSVSFSSDYADIKVDEKLIPVTGIEFEQSEATAATADGTFSLLPSVLPDDASNKNVSWSVSDESVATVSSDGTVTLIKKGTVTVTAVTEDGGFEASYVLNVLCSHANTKTVTDVPSTCLAQGHGAYTLCLDCGEIISGSDALLPVGDHSFVETVNSLYLKTPADCTHPAVYYKSCSVCGAASDETFEYGQPLGHNYVFSGFEWQGSEARAVYVCDNDHSHVEYRNASVKGVVKTQPDCENPGTTAYTATYDGHTETVDLQNIPATGHAYVFDSFVWDGKTAKAKYVCTHDASHVALYEATITSSVEDDTDCNDVALITYTATYDGHTDSIELPGLGHDYKFDSFVWTGSSAKAKFVCARNPLHVEYYDAAVTSVVKIPATCTEKGVTTYTASYYGNTESRDIEDIPALEHDYVFDSFVWEGTIARALFVCSRDHDHTEYRNASVKSSVGTAPTCEAMGTTVYTATYGSYADSKTVEDIPALGHVYVFEAFEWDGNKAYAIYRCEHDASHTESHEAAVSSAVKLAADCENAGITEYTASYDGHTEKITLTDIPALGHAYVFDSFVWNGTEAKAKYICANDASHVALYDAEMTLDTIPATCEEMGYTVHVASYDGHTDSRSIQNIPALGHEYVFDSYVDDGGVTKAKFVCAHDPSHFELRNIEDTWPAYKTDSASSYVDEEFEIEVRIVNNPGIVSLRFSVSFDSEAVELIGAVNKGLLYGYTVPSKDHSSPYVLRWADSLATENNNANGAVAVLRFRALSEGDTEITINAIDARDFGGSIHDFVASVSQVSIGPKRISVTGIEFGQSEATAATADGTFSLMPSVLPGNATNKNVSWSVSDESVATVSSDGTVTLIKKGTVTVTAVTEDGGFEASYVLNVLCSHANTHTVSAVPSTCLVQGHDAYTVCLDCGEIVSGSDALLPLGGHSLAETADDIYLKTPADCTHSAVFYKVCSVCGAISEETFEHGQPLGHDYVFSGFEWNGSEAKAVYVCENDHSHADRRTAAVNSAVKISPDCENPGTTTYTATYDGHTDSIDVQDIPATGHAFVFDSFVWDGKTAKAKYVCTHDATHVALYEASITSSVENDADCTDVAMITYTATFDGHTDSIELPGLGHDYRFDSFVWTGTSAQAKFVCARNPEHIEYYDAAVTSVVKVPATCTEKGVTTYTASYYGNTESKDLEDIPALGHDYVFDSFVWEGTEAKALFVCSHDHSHTEYRNAFVTSKSGTAPTCEAKGTTVYTATCCSYTDSKTVDDIPALGHSYVFDSFTWNGNKAYAIYRCEHDGSHTENHEADVSSAVKLAAGCETAGITEYTATYAGHTGRITLTDISPLGHAYVFDSFVWEGTTAKAKYICANDGSHVVMYDAEMTLDTIPATCEEEGHTVHIATYDGHTDSVYGQSIPALGHDYHFDSYVDDGGVTKAKFVCSHDPAHFELRDYESTLPALYATEAQTYVGDDFEVRIMIRNNPGIISLRLNFECDSQKVKFNKAQNTGLLNGYTRPSTNLASPYTLRWADSLATENNYEDGEIAVLKFTALAEGTSNIIVHFVEARNADGSKLTFREESAVIEIGPSRVPVTGIEMGSSSATVSTADGTFDISASVTPANASVRDLIWTSSDESVASVDGGTVTIHKHGTVTITATTAEGGFSASCAVTINCSHLSVHNIAEIPSTCTQQGRGAYTVCNDCGEIVGGSYAPLPLAAHDFIELAVPAALKTPAGCSAPAIYYKTCSACGALSDETFEYGTALGHNYVLSEFIWDGYTAKAKYVCSRDGSHMEFHDAEVISEVTKEATCTQTGIETYIASYDGHEARKDKQLPALGHTYEFSEFVWDGYTAKAKYVCGRDGSHVDLRDAEVTSVVTKAATCTDTGIETYTASYDGHEAKKDRQIPALGHTYKFSEFVWDGFTAKAKHVCVNDSEHVVYYNATVTRSTVTEPTCTENGLETYTASYDGKSASIDNVLLAKGHEFVFDSFVWTGSTAKARFVCTHDATHVEFYDAEITSRVAAAPTCTEPGRTAYKATYLDHTDEIELADIPVTAHNFKYVVLAAPGCEKAGLGADVCEDCGFADNYRVLDRLGHSFEDGKCTNCGAEKYDVTVTYVFTGASENNFTVTGSYLTGERYTYDTPAFTGYLYDIANVSGTVDGDVNVTVTYTPVRQIAVLSISAVDFGQVSYGTPFGALDLPGTVSAVTSTGGQVDLKVVWLAEDYDACSLGIQTVRGYVSGAYGYEIAGGFETLLTLSVETAVITACDEFDAGVYPYGTLKEDLLIPQYVAVKLASGGETAVPVVWNDFTLDGTETGTYIAKGSFELSEGYVIADSADAEPSLKFVILPEESDEYVPAENIILAKEVYELKVGETAELELFIVPSGEQHAIMAESNDTGIVLAAGSKLYAVAPGETFVTVRTTEGLSETVVVRVYENDGIPESVIASTGAVTLNVGKTYDLNAMLYPSSGDYTVTCSSDNGSVASVDGNGRITGVSGGTATVTLTAKDGTVISEVYVKVIGADEKAPCIQADRISGRPGSTITLVVYLRNNPGIVSYSQYIVYDTDILELIKVENSSLLKGYAEPSGAAESPVSVGWSDAKATKNNVRSGELVRFTFRIADDAPLGIYKINVVFKDAENLAGEKVTFINAEAAVKVSNVMMGDSDGDGELTDWDAILLNRYLAYWKLTIDLDAMDIDGDGEVTDWDAILFERYLAGWKIELW